MLLSIHVVLFNIASNICVANTNHIFIEKKAPSILFGTQNTAYYLDMFQFPLILLHMKCGLKWTK